MNLFSAILITVLVVGVALGIAGVLFDVSKLVYGGFGLALLALLTTIGMGLVLLWSAAINGGAL